MNDFLVIVTKCVITPIVLSCFCFWIDLTLFCLIFSHTTGLAFVSCRMLHFGTRINSVVESDHHYEELAQKISGLNLGSKVNKSLLRVDVNRVLIEKTECATAKKIQKEKQPLEGN